MAAGDDRQEIAAALRRAIQERTPDELRVLFSSQGVGYPLLLALDADTRMSILVEKNIKVFGSVNAYVDDFLGERGILVGLQQIPAGAAREAAKANQRAMSEKILNAEGLDDAHRQRLTAVLARDLAPGVGGRRRKTRRHRTHRRRV